MDIVNPVSNFLAVLPTDLPRHGNSMYPVTNIYSVDLLDAIVPGWSTAWAQGQYEVTEAAVTAWCEAHNAHYYARGDEDFSEYEAAGEAAALGKRIVVLDNLS